MSDNALEILIIGGAGSGKTTLAHLISRYLEQVGLKTEINDHGDVMSDLNIELVYRLEGLREKETTINIVTAQAQRMPIENDT